MTPGSPANIAAIANSGIETPIAPSTISFWCSRFRFSVLEESERGQPFRLRDASFRGRGVQPEFREGDWDRIRHAAYEGRGT
jgi:hypothetical protein